MENLNAEQIKYCLELILKSGIGMSRDDVDVTDIKRALALINSQEQRIKELEAECKQWRSDWEKNQKRWEIAYDELDKENHDLELTLVGVMFSVDKWLDGAELEQDEVNRAITMREKTLQIVENLKEKWEETINQVNYIADVTKADTVRKIADLLWQGESEKLNISVGGKYYDKQEFIDQIAKEMLEGEI